MSAQTSQTDGELPHNGSPTPVVYTDTWAYAPIGAMGERELYDLTKDPNAETDVAGNHPDVCDDLHAKLVDWLREMDAPEEAVAVFAPR